MKKKTKKKENKQVIEIHIYVHQNNLNGAAGTGIYYTSCTCGTYKGGLTSAPCPVHPLNPPYVVTCQS